MTPEQICKLKWSMTVESGHNCFDAPRNDIARRVALGNMPFTGCPGCKRESEAELSEEQIRADMQEFLDKLKRT